MNTAMELRTALLEKGCRFTAQIEAHLEDGTAEFTLDCSCAPDGNVTMEVTEPGILMPVRPLQFAKEDSPMETTESGSETLVRPLQPENAALLIVFTPLPMTTLFSPVQP